MLNECAHFQSVILLVANCVIYGWKRVEGACYDSPLNLNDIKARSNKDSKNGYAPDHQQQQQTQNKNEKIARTKQCREKNKAEAICR